MGGRKFYLFLSIVLVSGLPLSSARAASKEAIDLGVRETLEAFNKTVNGGAALVEKARGVLVFPSVKKAGLGIGGEYGQGALLIKGKTVAYYSTVAASIGFQFGVQARKEVILFLNDEALQKFRLSDGWEAGVDGSIAVITVGAGGEIDTTELNEPVMGFIFGSKGLMINLSLEGSKFSKIKE